MQTLYRSKFCVATCVERVAQGGSLLMGGDIRVELGEGEKKGKERYFGKLDLTGSTVVLDMKLGKKGKIVF